MELVDYEPGEDFHSLGMAYNETSSTLFVANNRHDGPRVDVFKLDFQASKAKHIRSIQHPLIHGPNSIVMMNSNEILVTNDHRFLMSKSRLLSQLETYLALPGGTVVHVDLSDPNTVDVNIVAKVPFANGIEMLNDSTIAIASTSKRAVNLYTITRSEQPGSPPTLTYQSRFRVPYHVDNLSRSSDGRLLMAGHPHAPSTAKFGKTRYVCNDPSELARADLTMQEYCKTGRATSWASEWTEAGGLKHIYADTEYPTSATAALDAEKKIGIIAGLYAKGILVWRE
jgi:arylesterase/paraoxonase